jgi:hypothetical protein
MCHVTTKFDQCAMSQQHQDSKHTASLEIPELSEAAFVAHVFSDMASNYLLSVGQLCNEGYYVTFRIDGATIYNFGSGDIGVFKSPKT